MNNVFEILKQTTTFESLPSNIQGAEVSEDIIITQPAMDKLIDEYNANGFDKTLQQSVVENVIEPSYFIRFFMQSSADKSKQYNIRFDNQLTNFDNVYQLGKIKIAIDRKSLFYFLGVIIDYIKTETEEGFIFLDTGDQKVSDYYLFKAQGQAWLDYAEATGKTLITSDKQASYKDVKIKTEEETDVLYQDEMYEESVPAVDDTMTENTDETTTESPVLELQDEEKRLESEVIEPNLEKEELPSLVEENAQKSESLATLEDELLAPAPGSNPFESNILQTLDTPSVAPPDKTTVAQKRTLTGIHFQD